MTAKSALKPGDQFTDHMGTLGGPFEVVRVLDSGNIEAAPPTKHGFTVWHPSNCKLIAPAVLAGGFKVGEKLRVCVGFGSAILNAFWPALGDIVTVAGPGEREDQISLVEAGPHANGWHFSNFELLTGPAFCPRDVVECVASFDSSRYGVLGHRYTVKAFEADNCRMHGGHLRVNELTGGMSGNRFRLVNRPDPIEEPVAAREPFRADDIVECVAMGTHGFTIGKLYTVKSTRTDSVNVTDDSGGFRYINPRAVDVVRSFRLAGRPRADGSGWVDWFGGPNPAPGQRVDCLTKQFPTTDKTATERMSEATVWSGESAVTAYRVVEPFKAEAVAEPMTPPEPPFRVGDVVEVLPDRIGAGERFVVELVDGGHIRTSEGPRLFRHSAYRLLSRDLGDGWRSWEGSEHGPPAGGFERTRYRNGIEGCNPSWWNHRPDRTEAHIVAYKPKPAESPVVTGLREAVASLPGPDLSHIRRGDELTVLCTANSEVMRRLARGSMTLIAHHVKVPAPLKVGDWIKNELGDSGAIVHIDGDEACVKHGDGLNVYDLASVVRA